MTDLQAIRKRLADCPIPETARSDWKGTDHYEVQDPYCETDYWWCIARDYFETIADSTTEDGKRLGAILDYSVAYKPDVGYLIKQLRKVAISEALDAYLTGAGVEIEERIRYVTIQLDRELWRTLQVLLLDSSPPLKEEW